MEGDNKMVFIEEISLLVSSDYDYGLDTILKTLENSDMELEGTKVIDYTSREVGVIKVKHNKFTLLDMTKKDDQYLGKG